MFYMLIVDEQVTNENRGLGVIMPTNYKNSIHIMTFKYHRRKHKFNEIIT